MLTVSKSELKAKMLEYFRRVEQSGEELIVTDNRVPVLKVTSLKVKRVDPRDVFGGYRGKIRYHEDILADTSGEWSEI